MEIPITNAAGLLECSPANTDPVLTKPRDGALDLRAAHPDRINYIRTAPSDDIQGPAPASFVFRDLGGKATAGRSTMEAAGREIADGFVAAYQKLGGRCVRRTLNPGADPATVLAPLRRDRRSVGGVLRWLHRYRAPEVRTRWRQRARRHPVPELGRDPGRLRRGPRLVPSSAGPAAAGSYLFARPFASPKADFVERYRRPLRDRARRVRGVGLRVRAGHRRRVARRGEDRPRPDLREAVRAYAVDPTHRYETVIGTLGFDANGDSLQQFVTFYRVDPSAANGKGDWVIAKQQDYGPAP